MRKKIGKTTTIRVPVEIRDTIRSLAQKRKVPYWKIVHESVTHYRLAYLSHFVQHTGKLNRAAWYAYKLAASVGEYRRDPCKETYEMLQRTIQQIEGRLGVDCSLLRKAVEVYAAKPDRRNRQLLNDAAKSVVGEVIATILSGEEQT